MKQFFCCLVTLLCCTLTYADQSTFDVMAITSTEKNQTINSAFTQTSQTIHPWLVTCIHSSMTNPTNNTKQLEMKMCKAKQTINKKIAHKSITASANISSIMTHFTIKNLKISENSAKLIIGKNKPILLNVFCDKNHQKPTCSLMIQDKEITTNEMMSTMNHADNFTLNLVAASYHRPIIIKFSLTNFTKIRKIILSADNHIKNIFQLTK